MTDREWNELLARIKGCKRCLRVWDYDQRYVIRVDLCEEHEKENDGGDG